MTALTFSATIFNIDVTGTQTPDTFDNLVAAHIHAPAPPGINAPVVWGFFGTPDNDNSPDDLVVTPFSTGVGGVFTSKWDLPEGNAGTTLSAQAPNILAGQSYLNFHTVQFGGGEIRGQIDPRTLHDRPAGHRGPRADRLGLRRRRRTKRRGRRRTERRPSLSVGASAPGRFSPGVRSHRKARAGTGARLRQSRPFVVDSAINCLLPRLQAGTTCKSGKCRASQ